MSTSMKKFKNVKSKVHYTCTCSVRSYATVLLEFSLTLKACGELISMICLTNTLTYCLPIFSG